MEEKDSKVKETDKEASRHSVEKEAQSRLTYSSLQNSKECRCDSQRDILSGLF
jgi:hypothetical protein